MLTASPYLPQFSAGWGGAVYGILLLACVCLGASSVYFSRVLLATFEEVSDNEIPVRLQLPHRLLALFVASKTVAYAGIAVIAFLVFPFWYFGGWMFTASLLLSTLFAVSVSYLLCEVLPQSCFRISDGSKAVAWRFAQKIDMLLRPFVAIADACFQLQRRVSLRHEGDALQNELSKAVELTSTEMKEGKNLLESIGSFGDKTAVEIMTPREDMTCLNISAPFAEVLYQVLESRYSRIPVYEKNEDNIRGILYVKDLLPVAGGDSSYRWQQVLRPAYYVPENKPIDLLLSEFRTGKMHMAVVVDEFGGTSGLVTMEDILEEIVGEISDEYDEDKKPFVRLSDGSLIFEGKTLLTDFFREVNLNPDEFANFTTEVETLAGLLLELKSDFPRRQEVLPFQNYRFQVLEIDRRRIIKVRFFVETPETDDPN